MTTTPHQKDVIGQEALRGLLPLTHQFAEVARLNARRQLLYQWCAILLRRGQLRRTLRTYMRPAAGQTRFTRAHLKRLGAVITFVGVVIALTIDVPVFLDLFRRPPPMTGVIRVAVPEFTTAGDSIDSSNRDDLNSLATALARVLERAWQDRFSGEGIVAVRYPDQAGAVPGDNPAREDALREVAEDHAADIVVAGTVRASDSSTRIDTRFYLSPRLLDTEGAELEGMYEFGPPLTVRGNVFRNAYSSSEMQTLVARRTDVIADLLTGIFLYLNGDYTASISQLQALEDKWRDSSGKEVIYLFLGNAAGKIDDYDQASEFYRRGIDEQPHFARNVVGLAETLYHQGSGGICEADEIDARLLQRSRELYQEASSIAPQSHNTYAIAKAKYGEGRLLYCMSDAGLKQQWQAAEARLNDVIALHEAAEDGLAQLAAESWAVLGLLRIAESPNSNAAVLAAIECYDHAIRLSTDEIRRRAFARVRRSIVASRNADAPTRMR